MADILVVDKASRSVTVPPGFVLGVESDEQTNNVTFKIPRWVGNDSDIDLSLFTLQIIYMNASNIKGTYSIADVKTWTTEDDTAHPDLKADGQFLKVVWHLSRLATLTQGKTYFVLCATTRNNDGAVTNEWNTEICGVSVKQGLEINDSDLTSEAESVINQLLAQMSASASDASRSAREAATSAEEAATSAQAASESETQAAQYEGWAKNSKNSADSAAQSARTYASQAADAKSGAVTAQTAAEKAAASAKASADTAAGYAGAVTYSLGVDSDGYLCLYLNEGA